MIVVFLCDPMPGYPEYDFQVWHFMSYGDWLVFASKVGEWAWVGRV